MEEICTGENGKGDCIDLGHMQKQQTAHLAISWSTRLQTILNSTFLTKASSTSVVCRNPQKLDHVRFPSQNNWLVRKFCPLRIQLYESLHFLFI